jgi:hypothetical protein
MKSVLTVPAMVLLATTAHAQPFANQNTAPPVGKIYTFTTTTVGSNGIEVFKISPPPAGYYMMSFKANFQTHGAPDGPLTDICWLELDGATIAQSTGIDFGNFNVGVSAETPVNIRGTSHLKAACGSTTAWLFADVPLQVTLVRADSETTGTLKDEGSELTHRPLPNRGGR